MPTPITPERLARRAAIAAALREHGPQTSRQVYSRCPDMPDITECCRLIGEMRKAGELTTEGKVHWIVDRIRPEGWTAEQEHVLQESRAAVQPKDAMQPEPDDMPEPELVTDAEFDALTKPPADIVLDRDDEPAPLFWYSSDGEMRIGFEGDVPIALTAAGVERLVAFLRRVGLVE